MFKDGLRRAQSTDSLGTSGSLQSKALGYNNKAKSAGNLDESDFGPLVGADSVSENYDTASLGSLQMPSGFMLTKDQEKAIKAMTPEQEETASLLSSVTQGVESAYVSPSGYRLVSETEWNLLQKEVSAHRASAVSIPRVAGGCVLWAARGKRLLSSPGCALLAVRKYVASYVAIHFFLLEYFYRLSTLNIRSIDGPRSCAQVKQVSFI